MNCNNTNEELIETLTNIEKIQNDNSYHFDLKLGNDQSIFNTIPLILICKSNCKCYIGTGVFKDLSTDSYKCFETPVFRLTKIDINKNSVLLELLQPQGYNGEISPFSFKDGICKFFSTISINKFIRTGICTKINLDCLCGIECLPPVYAKRDAPKGIKDCTCNATVKTLEYITISNGFKKEYYDNDGIKEFNIIPDPSTISYSNLFINGMLQPPSFYTIVEGKLSLNTDDIPMAGTYIILQLITVIK